MSHVAARSISVAYDGRVVLDRVTLHADRGDVVAVVGPNGAGKTTLLRCLAGEMRVNGGTVTIGDADPEALSAPDRASVRAFLGQADRPDVPYETRTVVGFGTHLSKLDADGQDELVDRCMAELEIDDLGDRIVATLSGGERRRVSLARTFAQGASTLLLDEPTDSLDFAHADMAMEAARARAVAGATVVLTTHDIDLASKHASRIVVLDAGAVAADGTPSEVLTAELLSNVYRCRIEVGRHPVDGRPIIYR